MLKKLILELSSLIKYDEIDSVLLTGGRSAQALYKLWSVDSEFDYYKQVNFFFGDERCVAVNHPDSNYQMVMDVFSDIVSKDRFERIHGEAEYPADEVKRYEVLLPNVLDLILLSVGEDGHIASLFPYSLALKSKAKVAYVGDSPKLPAERITITPPVILNAKHVVVLAAGEEKGRVMARALDNPFDILELPVRLTIGQTWVLDEEAAAAFLHCAPENHYNTKIIYG